MNEDEGCHFTAPLSALQTLTSVTPHELDPDTIHEILFILGKSENDPDATRFIRALAHQIGHLKTTLRLKRETTISQPIIRKELAQIQKQSKQLVSNILNLDPAVLWELDLAIQQTNPSLDPDNKPSYVIGTTDDVSKDSRAHLNQLIQELEIISAAVNVIESRLSTNAKGGRPNKNSRLFLARGIAKAFNEILHIQPTTTKCKESPYLSILRIALREADVHIEDVSKLACDALNQI